MRLTLLDKSALIITFIVGGLYGFTDFNGPRDPGTFLGSAMVVMLLSLGLGWILNKALRMSTQYKDMTERMNKKISPTIVMGAVCSLIFLISGVID